LILFRNSSSFSFCGASFSAGNLVNSRIVDTLNLSMVTDLSPRSLYTKTDE
jgi:hypothetical protein